MILANTLTEEGVSIVLNNKVVEVSESDHLKQVILADGTTLAAESLLVAIGRRPVVDSLNPDEAGIRYDEKGIKVNRKMQTSNKRIYAAAMSRARCH